MLHLIEQACAVASSVLLGAKRRRTQGACSSLPPTLQPNHYQVCARLYAEPPANVSTDGASMCGCSSVRGGATTQCACSSLPPTLQACGCPLVRGGARRRTPGACLSLPPALQPRTCKICVIALRRSLHGMLHLIKQACAAPRCEAEVDARCVLVLTAVLQGSPTTHLHDGLIAFVT